MTESEESSVSSNDPARDAAFERYREKVDYDVDTRLSIYLDLMFGIDDENTEAQASFTLITPGGVIQGLAVHPKKYAEAQIARVTSASENMGKAMALVEEGLEKLRERQRGEFKDEPRGNRPYLHFLTATYISGPTTMNLSDLRVDLKSVIAWTLGS